MNPLLEKCLKDYRDSAENLARLKECLFPIHSTKVAYVTNPGRYCGFGIAIISDGCPADQMDVLLENGNIWRYPLETVAPSNCEQDFPRWVKEYLRRTKR